MLINRLFTNNQKCPQGMPVVDPWQELAARRRKLRAEIERRVKAAVERRCEKCPAKESQ
jgi:hypothetical protein